MWRSRIMHRATFEERLVEEARLHDDRLDVFIGGTLVCPYGAASLDPIRSDPDFLGYRICPVSPTQPELSGDVQHAAAGDAKLVEDVHNGTPRVTAIVVEDRRMTIGLVADSHPLSLLDGFEVDLQRPKL